MDNTGYDRHDSTIADIFLYALPSKWQEAINIAQLRKQAEVDVVLDYRRDGVQVLFGIKPAHFCPRKERI